MSLSPGNSFVVELNGLKNAITNEFVNDATVTGIIKDSSGTVVQATFTLDFVASSNGNYRKTLAPIAGLIIGNTYITTIDAVGTDSLEFQEDQKNRATKRVSCA